MFSESDDTIRRLEHEKNVWRGIAIGLGATLLLLLVLGGAGGLLLARSQHQAMRAEEAAMREAVQQRDQAERARMAAQRVVEKAKQP
jgi:Flp pilus assembly protein protease CpaA